MVKTVFSSSIRGLFWQLVHVEVDVSPGLPSFSIVGLGDTAVQESRERVRTAIRNSGFSFPQKRVTVNLAPAEIRKAWPGFDLAIAIGIIAEECGLKESDLKGIAVLGELALDGTLRNVGGIVAHAASLGEYETYGLLASESDAQTASFIPNVIAYGAKTLREAVEALQKRRGGKAVAKKRSEIQSAVRTSDFPDFSDIAGQERAKRALEIAAAGGHNVLLEWAPWSGKTLLCRAFQGILPKVSPQELITLAKIRSVSGSFSDPFSLERPFVSVHSGASAASLLWWWPLAKPGEITLAHLGTLFLDELREFPPYLLDALRQPLEEGKVRVSRALASHSYPARFQLLAATNPCPCGYLSDREKPCTCAPGSVERYRNRISGPILDRIDLFVGVPRLSSIEIGNQKRGDASAKILERVVSARSIQFERFWTREKTNASLLGKELSEMSISPEAEKSALEAVDRLGLSGRAYDRIRKVSRTIADLDGSKTVEIAHMAEAMSYRER